MHSETYKILAASLEAVRADLKDMFPRMRLSACIELARAETLIAEHDAAEEAARTATLPSSWAHVHEVDCAGVTGIITRIPGGLRVEWLDADVPDSATEPAWRTRDVFAISRVDWITKEAFQAHTDMTRSMVADAIKQRLRNSTMPEGYVLVVSRSVAERPYAVQRADGLVLGYWGDTNRPREVAWEAADGQHGKMWTPPRYPMVPFTGDLSIPF